MSKHEAHIKQHTGDSHSIEQGYEVSDVQAKGLLMAGVVIVLATVVAFVFSIVVANWAMHGERGRISDTELSPLVDAADELHNEWVTDIRLQVDLGEQLREAEADAHRGLATYEILDEAPETYRIPIDEAIKLVVKNGLPEFPKVEAKL